MLKVDYADRLAKFEAVLQANGIDAGVISPGPDLRYLLGYDAVPLERLTALLVRPGHDPILIAPFLELAAAASSPAGTLGIEIATWGETDDPYELVAKLSYGADSFAVDARMWAEKLLRLQQAMPSARALSAAEFVSSLRMVKSQVEIQALRAAGAAIDRVHAQVPNWLRVGRTEREVGQDIATAIRAEGHATVDFVIVGSGPNSASPHHEVSDRVIQNGDAVVVDIGGAMPDGYCSDSTRTYHMGQPSTQYQERYDALLASQMAATSSVKPGATCESIDRAARDVLTEAGIGDLFIHRVGHGIGLETHEDPYMVTGNMTKLVPGMAFSIEPGFYEHGVAGARIEDIVVCGESEADALNLRPRELAIL